MHKILIICLLLLNGLILAHPLESRSILVSRSSQVLYQVALARRDDEENEDEELEDGEEWADEDEELADDEEWVEDDEEEDDEDTDDEDEGQFSNSGEAAVFDPLTGGTTTATTKKKKKKKKTIPAASNSTLAINSTVLPVNATTNVTFPQNASLSPEPLLTAMTSPNINPVAVIDGSNTAASTAPITQVGLPTNGISPVTVTAPMINPLTPNTLAPNSLTPNPITPIVDAGNEVAPFSSVVVDDSEVPGNFVTETNSVDIKPTEVGNADDDSEEDWDDEGEDWDDEGEDWEDEGEDWEDEGEDWDDEGEDWDDEGDDSEEW